MRLTERVTNLLQVASYNVHRYIGRDGLFSPERVVDVIHELSVDVLGLQEACLQSIDGTNHIELVGDGSGLRGVTGPTICRDGNYFGNVLLTRFDILAVRHIDLSIPKREPRAALDVDVRCYGKAVRVIVTHLGLGRAERKAQVARLLHRLSGKRRIPTVLLGDMNEWVPRARSMRSLSASFARSPSLRTFPARLPVLPLDRIFVWPHEALLKARVHISRLARIASDHLPIKGFIMLE